MPELLRGQFLIAARHLKDPNFFQAVVLIVEHSSSGAMGVVVNRPSGVTVAQSLKNHFDLPESGEMVYVGGPVERNALFILHDAADLDTSENPVVEGLFVGGSPEMFESIIRRAADGDEALHFRVYFGCAGWGADQLEGELARNDWLVLPALAEYVFQGDPYELWEQMVALHRRANPLVRDTMFDPELN